jgi:hypothetical protein
MIKVLKSTLKAKYYKQNVLDLQINEIVMSPELMDALDIISGEIVDVNSLSGTFRAYVTEGLPSIKELLFGGFVNGNVLITSYAIMNRESAQSNNPIRLGLVNHNKE